MLPPHIREEAGLEDVRAALARVPPFEGVRLDDVGLERLGGALTNVSYKVVTGAHSYVLRLAGGAPATTLIGRPKGTTRGRQRPLARTSKYSTSTRGTARC